MAHAEGTTTINRPVNIVFDFVLDGTKTTLWRPAVLDINLQPGKPLGVGAVFKQGVKGPGGRRIDADYEIVECKPNDTIKFQVTAGPARPMGTYKFEPVGDSTRLTFTLHFDPKGLAILMNGMIQNTMKEEVATLNNLKSYMESH
jgi:hypothetical protein